MLMRPLSVFEFETPGVKCVCVFVLAYLSETVEVVNVVNETDKEGIKGATLSVYFKSQ